MHICFWWEDRRLSSSGLTLVPQRTGRWESLPLEHSFSGNYQLPWPEFGGRGLNSNFSFFFNLPNLCISVKAQFSFSANFSGIGRSPHSLSHPGFHQRMKRDGLRQPLYARWPHFSPVQLEQQWLCTVLGMVKESITPTTPTSCESDEEAQLERLPHGLHLPCLLRCPQRLAWICIQ